MARREIQLKIQLKLGQMVSIALAGHSSLVNVISGLFKAKDDGSSIPKPDPSRKNLGEGHSDVNMAVAALNRAMRF